MSLPNFGHLTEEEMVIQIIVENAFVYNSEPSYQ